MIAARHTLVTIVGLLLCSSAFAVEVRTYRFTGDEYSYRFSCGECAGPPYTHRARVEGTFQVELDFESGSGVLTELNARLVGLEGAFPTGPGWDEWEWRPIGPDQDFLPRNSRFFDWYGPPFSGVLALAENHPLAPTNSSRGLLGPNFPAPEPDALFFANDGRELTPDGRFFRSVSTFQIAMKENEAIFSYHIPIIDAVPSIMDATAVRLVPEPASAALFGAIALGAIGIRAYRRQAFSWRICTVHRHSN